MMNTEVSVYLIMHFFVTGAVLSFIAVVDRSGVM